MPIITTYPFKKAPLNKKDEITISDVDSANAGFKTKNTTLEILAEYIVLENSFIFTQSIPETVWNITHGLGKFASVTVVSDSNQVMIGNTEYINANQVQLTFSAAFSGKAYFN
tara:strand:+ start:575 stop:913 length:339 start_codon:yes stop_codon:yes gene_type:complete